MKGLYESIRRDPARWVTLVILLLFFILAVRGLVDHDAEGGERYQDVVITVLRGLSTGSIIFLVASGFSIIFGLMGVLNMAHGAMFMIGAYVGWTVLVRPDTAVDAITPALLLISGFLLAPLWQHLLGNSNATSRLTRIWPWASLLLTVLILGYILPQYPISIWEIFTI